MVFLGFPMTFQADGHIRVDVVDLYVSEKTRRWLARLAACITTVTLAFLAWHMGKPAMDAYKYGERMQELGLPNWVLWVPMIAGVALSALIAWRVVLSPEEAPAEATQESR
jgi:TRAP-type C4-dicarboxylate transport system permease small subunit